MTRRKRRRTSTALRWGQLLAVLGALVLLGYCAYGLGLALDAAARAAGVR